MHWRASILFSFPIAMLTALSLPAAEENKEPKPKEVIIKNFKFLVDGKEQPLVIKVGDSVVWVNQDDEEHSAMGSGKEFDTGHIEAGGKSKPIKFTKASEGIKYHCHPHPKMKGTIIVKEK